MDIERCRNLRTKYVRQIISDNNKLSRDPRTVGPHAAAWTMTALYCLLCGSIFGTLQICVVSCFVVPCRVMSHCIVLCRVMSCPVVFYFVVSCCGVLCDFVFCRSVLCCVVLCCFVSCCTARRPLWCLVSYFFLSFCYFPSVNTWPSIGSLNPGKLFNQFDNGDLQIFGSVDPE